MNREPFEAIVARYGSTVLRVCRAVLDPMAAEDAWSDTFLAALRAYPNLRPNSNVEGWLSNSRWRQRARSIKRAAALL